jgi:hypothetical protein
MKQIKLTAVCLTAMMLGAQFAQATGAPVVVPAFDQNDLDAIRHKVEPANPNHNANRAAEKSTVRALDSALKRLNHSGVEAMDKLVVEEPVNEGFRYPWISLEGGYGYSDDQRAGGLETDLWSTVLSMGFTTFYDWDIGGMFIYSGSDGDAPGLDSDGENFTGAIFASRKLFFDWLYIGGSASYTAGEEETSAGGVSRDTETDTWGLSPFLMAIYQTGAWTFSTTPTYLVSLQDLESDGADDSTDTHRFNVANRIRYNFTDRFSAEAFASPVVLLDTPENDEDDFWLNTGVKLGYIFSENWNIYSDYSYDAFNSDWENHNVNLGINYNF